MFEQFVHVANSLIPSLTMIDDPTTATASAIAITPTTAAQLLGMPCPRLDHGKSGPVNGA